MIRSSNIYKYLCSMNLCRIYLKCKNHLAINRNGSSKKKNMKNLWNRVWNSRKMLRNWFQLRSLMLWRRREMKNAKIKVILHIRKVKWVIRNNSRNSLIQIYQFRILTRNLMNFHYMRRHQWRNTNRITHSTLSWQDKKQNKIK